LGDDIAWLRPGPDGRLWAINPEAGFFGVAPGTSMKNNPNMIRTIKKNNFFPTLFTNTALNPDTKEPWWEGLDGEKPANLIDWQGQAYDPANGKAAHPNSRFTVSIYNCPTLSPEYDNPKGVPISAIIIGGRRANTVPLVAEARDWEQGVFMGARTGSETTAAASGQIGVIRRDPFAMLPFCGYNMGDYFDHWLKIGKKLKHPPKIFQVNWFRTDAQGKFIWPGFGDNIRVLKWVLDRVEDRVGMRETAIGCLPHFEDLEFSGLGLTMETLKKLFEVNLEQWEYELKDTEKFLLQFGDHLPNALWTEYYRLKDELGLHDDAAYLASNI
jgi:phosphoenolpyruvate carboxykinase (GTP)